MGNLSSEKPDLNQTWMLTDGSQMGWHASKEQVDILRFSDNSMIEMISIEEGKISADKYELNEHGEIILGSGTTYGRIKSITQNELVIQHGDENALGEKKYTPLPQSEIAFSEAEIIQTIKNETWTLEVKRPSPEGKMTWTLSQSMAGAESDIQLVISKEDRNIIMPTELKRIENAWFLSCQIPDIFTGAANSTLGREHFLIKKMTKDEIEISFSSNQGVEIKSFKKEE